MFQRFTFDSAGAPVHATVPHLGGAQIFSFHTVVEFQLKSLPNEPNPYLWPLESTVIAITDKGKLTITNRYSPKT
jgi:hypothetical protein